MHILQIRRYESGQCISARKSTRKATYHSHVEAQAIGGQMAQNQVLVAMLPLG